MVTKGKTVQLKEPIHTHQATFKGDYTTLQSHTVNMVINEK